MSVTFTAQWKTGDQTEFGKEINIANGNAVVLLDLLGYGPQAEPDGEFFGVPLLPEAFGDASPENFLGRTLIARGLLDIATDDEHGKPWTDNGGGPGTGRALVIDCGRQPGYLAEKLSCLEEIARDAAVHSGIVAWG